jgi:hypothetical protein
LSFDESISGAFNIFARYNKNESKLAERFGISSAWSFGAGIAFFQIRAPDAFHKKRVAAEQCFALDQIA